ncbi:hypothetical protein TFLX_01113 [Thermoflexales bacterium]|nr:hypothetical protein TFLX_01113 [Thermoflexales bacterium]
MSEPYQACALYQQLVRHVQQCAAEELAALRQTSVEAEYNHIDQIIRDWLFAPQRDLHGSAPREVMRREQLDEPNVLPPPSPDDDELTQELHEIEALLGGEERHHWFVDDGGRSLLDEFDPEGQEEYLRILDERAAARQQENDLLGTPPNDEEWPFSQN